MATKEYHKKYNFQHKLDKKKNREQKRHRLMEILGGVHCKTKGCGYSDARALHFDHIKSSNGKYDKKIKRYGHTLVTYYLNHPEEAKENLQILCSNCHSIKTYH